MHKLLVAAAALLVGATLPVLSNPAQAAAPPIKPLPSNLESIRASEATALYGSPEIRPIANRKTAVVTMGDSEISGEGVGNYEAGTHTDGPPANWCDRSLDQAVWRLTITVDVRYNVSCSGGEPAHMQEGNGRTQWNELNQGDNLAIKARNTRMRLIWIVAGANGEGNIQFGPVVTDCTKRRLFFQGPCWSTYTNVWATRVAGSQQSVTNAVNSVKQTMTDAGYLRTDYELVVMGYPGPASPDVEDNPNFPGWYDGGCTIYLADLAFARNKAVPMFERGIRAAAIATGARYLDASRLFHGHEVCEDNPWARGLYIENGNIFDENAARQSYHPNFRGHGAFTQCMSAFYNSGWATASCVDVASTGNATLYNGLLTFKQLKNAGTGACVDGEGYNSRNGTAQLSYTCHGGRNQGFWYDSGQQSIHSELSHDRCLDIKGGIAAGSEVLIWNCHGGTNQNWVFSGSQIKPASNSGLCLAFDSPSSGYPRLRLAACGTSTRQQWSFETRNFANPVGYGYSDFIGSRVY
ncbi:MAG TPA: hypothetical protein DGT23_14170 [Micromonosporaceae bacterium]|nr:hypothetical protein [Micromonosporaceae bacterium]